MYSAFIGPDGVVVEAVQVNPHTLTICNSENAYTDITGAVHPAPIYVKFPSIDSGQCIPGDIVAEFDELSLSLRSNFQMPTDYDAHGRMQGGLFIWEQASSFTMKAEPYYHWHPSGLFIPGNIRSYGFEASALPVLATLNQNSAFTNLGSIRLDVADNHYCGTEWHNGIEYRRLARSLSESAEHNLATASDFLIATPHRPVIAYRQLYIPPVRRIVCIEHHVLASGVYDFPGIEEIAESIVRIENGRLVTRFRNVRTSDMPYNIRIKHTSNDRVTAGCHGAMSGKLDKIKVDLSNANSVHAGIQVSANVLPKSLFNINTSFTYGAASTMTLTHGLEMSVHLSLPGSMPNANITIFPVLPLRIDDWQIFAAYHSRAHKLMRIYQLTRVDWRYTTFGLSANHVLTGYEIDPCQPSSCN